MLKVVLLLMAVGAMGLPVLLQQQFTMPDASYAMLATTMNPAFMSGMFVGSVSGKVAFIPNAGASAQIIADFSTQPQPTTPPPSVLTAMAVHPMASKIYFAYVRQPTAMEMVTLNITSAVTGVNHVPVFTAVLSEFIITGNFSMGVMYGTTSERPLFTLPVFDTFSPPFSSLTFGPDGFLYIGTSNVFWRNAQGLLDPDMLGRSPSTLWGKILCIDINGMDTKNNLPYNIPPMNPYRNIAGYRAETYAMGFESPQYPNWINGTMLTVIDNTDPGYPSEIDVVSSQGDFGFNVVCGNLCYINPNCTMVGQPALSLISAALPPIQGFTPYNNRYYMSYGTGLIWYTNNLMQNNSVTVLDAQGYGINNRFPNLNYLAIQTHPNGTLYVMGSATGTNSLIFSIVEETSSAALARPMAVAVLLVVLLALLL